MEFVDREDSRDLQYIGVSMTFLVCTMKKKVLLLLDMYAVISITDLFEIMLHVSQIDPGGNAFQENESRMSHCDICQYSC